MDSIAALWFDGRSSRAHEVRVSLRPSARGPSLAIERAGAAPLQLSAREVTWPQAWSAQRAPRKLVVDLRAHGSLEIGDPLAFHAALAAAGGRPSLAQRMQTRWAAFAAVALVAAAALAVFYRWGTPWLAVQLTREVPLEWERAISRQVLQDLDAQGLHASRLPAQRQEALRARFDALANQVPPSLRPYGGYAPHLQLVFRSGLGANAFALPGGTIVLTDGIVLAADRAPAPDDALLGVLAHEMGHVMHRHTTRLVVEQGVLNVGLGLALGDLSTVVASGSALLTGLAYHRDHETEADCYAVALLRHAGVPTQPMADLLLAIDADAHAHTDAPAWTTLLSSHPDTPARAMKIKEGKLEACQANV
jgi:Zn-dependent protease with chaperone function